MYVCVGVHRHLFHQDFSPLRKATTFQKLYPSNTLVVNATHTYLCTRTHTYTVKSIPSASRPTTHSLCEVAADVQGLLVHLSHVLQVPQQREAAIVPWGAFCFVTTAELRSLEWWGCLEALEVGKLQQVFS